MRRAPCAVRHRQTSSRSPSLSLSLPLALPQLAPAQRAALLAVCVCVFLNGQWPAFTVGELNCVILFCQAGRQRATHSTLIVLFVFFYIATRDPVPYLHVLDRYQEALGEGKDDSTYILTFLLRLSSHPSIAGTGRREIVSAKVLLVNAVVVVVNGNLMAQWASRDGSIVQIVATQDTVWFMWCLDMAHREEMWWQGRFVGVKKRFAGLVHETDLQGSGCM